MHANHFVQNIKLQILVTTCVGIRLFNTISTKGLSAISSNETFFFERADVSLILIDPPNTSKEGKLSRA